MTKMTTKAAMAAMAGALAMTVAGAAAEAKPPPKPTKTTASTATKKKPRTYNAATTARPSQKLLPEKLPSKKPPSKKPSSKKLTVTFKPTTKDQRTAASTLRTTQRGNAVALSPSTRDARSPNAKAALQAKQASRSKPKISKTSETALQNAVATGLPPTTASRGATRAGAAPIGSGQATMTTAQMVQQTAQRKGLPQQQRPNIFVRAFGAFKGLFRRGS